MFAGLLLAVLAFDAMAEGAVVGSKKVLILYSSESTLPAAAAFTRGLLETLNVHDGRDVEIYTEYLDAQRFSYALEASWIKDILSEKYANIPFDLVITTGVEAWKFVNDYRQIFGENTPFISAIGGDEDSQPPPVPPRAVVFLNRIYVGRTVELGMRLQPDAKNLVVIAGAASRDEALLASARKRLAPFTDRISIRYLTGLTYESLLEEVKRLSANTIVLYLTVLEDGAGKRLPSPDTAARVAAVSKAPVYAIYETHFGGGIVGGYMIPFDFQGRRVGALALRVLEGENPESVGPEISGSPVNLIDWRAVERWGLDPVNIPKDAAVMFRRPSLWDRHRELVLAVIAVVLLQSAFIIALLIERRHRRRVEGRLRESEERYSSVVETQSELICRYLPDTTLTFVNDAYCRFFGRRRTELVGARWLDLIPEAARPGMMRHVNSLVARPRAETYEHEVLRPDGTLGWQLWTNKVIFDAGDRIVEVQAIGRDLTELRQAEAEIQERRREVTHLTRVSILGELSGSVAHELNQPLSAILSNAQAARRMLKRAAPNLVSLGEILDDIILDDKRAGAVICPSSGHLAQMAA